MKAAADALRRLAVDPSSAAECVTALKQVPLVHPLRAAVCPWPDDYAGSFDYVRHAAQLIEYGGGPLKGAFLTALADKLEAGIDEMRRTGWGWVLGAAAQSWFHAAPPNGELILPDVGL